MSTVALNRQFYEWGDKKAPDPAFAPPFGRSELKWEDISARRRVVILAEAGSGKTKEMREQTRLRTAAGQFAFYATVEDVDRDGLDRALGISHRARLDEWRRSDQPAWFLVDSIDEAKLGRVSFERAVRRIADGIAGSERRAHIVLSCRITDWEFRRDLERLSEALPIPPDAGLPPPPSPGDEPKRVLRYERTKEQPPAEQPLVVLMAPLDPERVRLFASAKGAPETGAFLDQIEAGNLWQFARRPLDLDWLVDFWQTHRRLGSLAEMLENSLMQRVRETNLGRARSDSLDATRAVHAIERIGAALVFGRKATIAIPDSELLWPEDEGPLDLAAILPNWSIEDRTRLLSRPFFDPATFGRARLHNDNEAVVRGYLTARWLRRLRAGGNLSHRELFDLLFSTTYDVKLVKPSLMETAAWLALWEEDVGREIASRAPSLLLTAGDPATLPVAVREAVLTDVVEQLAADGPRLPLLDQDSLRRFVQPDMSRIIHTLWTKHKDYSGARDFLLRLIWLGRLQNCGDLVASAAFGTYPERSTMIVAGRALTTISDDATKRRFVDYVKTNARKLPNTVVIDAIDAMFPDPLTISNLLDILAEIDVTDADYGPSIEWQAPAWIDRVESRPELQKLLTGLLVQLGPEPQDIGHITNKREDTYYSAIAAAATRLLECCKPDEAPVETIDAALRLGLAYRFGQRPPREIRDVRAQLLRTAARRRMAFWRAAEQRSKHQWLQGRPIESPYDLELFGYSLGLTVEDIEWLLADAPTRLKDHERKLAINAAMHVWHGAGCPDDMCQKIESAARSDPAMGAAYQRWVAPPVPFDPSPEEQELAKLQKKAKEEQAARDQSWVEFIDRLRKNPDELRNIPPPTAEAVDGRLYHLWHLLYETVDASTRYAISSVAPLEPMLGREVAEAFRDALVKFWRQWKPKRKSEKTEAERNQMGALDMMGICGISLEAATNPHWAEHLSSHDAARAVAYGTLEINGFPSWLSALALAKPTEMRDVLLTEVLAELDDPKPRSRYEVLEDISRSGPEVIQLMASPLFATLNGRPEAATAALDPLLRILAGGLREERTDFAVLALARFNTEDDDARRSGLYLGAAFAIDPDAATGALSARLGKLSVNAQTALVQEILPSLFGTWFGINDRPVRRFSFSTLEKIVRIAYRTIRVEDDRNRPSGKAYSPDLRDNAEQARNTAFGQLVEIPGRATFAALLRLAEVPDFPIPAKRLRELAMDRAAKDSESAAWLPSQVINFEETREEAPSTPHDLQRTALRRFDDMQHDLLHSDFAQGATLRGLPDENAVQNWMADRLRLKQGRSYSVEREPHVVDEKEPDVRLRAKVTDASLAIEIKVPENWSVKELEVGLTQQLCGRYLRARDAQHGILLLVHQRPKRWKEPTTGKLLQFTDIVERLRGLARAIASERPDSPQPEIAVIDVSEPAKRRGKVSKGGKRKRKDAKGKRLSKRFDKVANGKSGANPGKKGVRRKRAALPTARAAKDKHRAKLPRKTAQRDRGRRKSR